MKTESRVSRGECCYSWDSVKSVGAHRGEVNLQVFFLSCNSFHLLILREFLLCCFHKGDPSVSSFHSRGGDKIQQLHQLPPVPQWEKN